MGRRPEGMITRSDGRHPVAFSCAVAALLLGFASVGAAAAGPAEWTILAYLSGDSNLEAAAVRYLHTLAAAPAEGSVAIAVQLDMAAHEGQTGDATGATRWVLTSPPGARQRQPVKADWHREVNMGDPATLGDFAQWAVGRCPAKRYLLLIMGHGNGVRAQRPDGEETLSSGVAYDATSGGDCLTTAELGQACRRVGELIGGRLSVLAIDSCFSATVELGCEVAPSVEYLTGSPGLIYEPGVPWDLVLDGLTARPGMGGGELARLAVECVGRAAHEPPLQEPRARTSYLAADLSRARELEATVAELSGALQGSVGRLWPLISFGRSATQTAGLHADMVDLPGFLRGLAEAASRAGETQVAELAARGAETADAMVLARVAPEGDCGSGRLGWAVFFPPGLTAFPADYLDTGQFARQAKWGSFLGAYLGHLKELVTPTAQQIGARGA